MRKNKNISLSKKPVFFFVIDGKCEYWYLQLLKQHENLNVNLEPKLPNKKKLKDQFESVKNLSKDNEVEKVFWIIDFDTILKETRECKQGNETPLQKFQKLCDKCKNNKKIHIIVNNPSLEYWFLQHFVQTAKHYESYTQLKPDLTKHLSDYDKTEKYYKNSREDIYQKLYPNLQTAISNSEKLGEFDFENIHIGIAEMYKVFKTLGFR